MAKSILRSTQLYGPQGRLGVGRTKFFEHYVYDRRRGGKQYIPGTKVPRLKVAHIGPKVVVAFDDEVDELIEALRRARDEALDAEVM